MPYTTPIYDRVLSDVTTPTAKGMFNCIAGVTIGGIISVDDWGRVYGNASYVQAEILTNTGHTVTFITISTPTTAQDPTTMAAMFNNLLANIEAMRLYVNLHGATISQITTLIYVAGAGNYAPNYLDVNQWEYCLDQIKLFTDANVFTPVFILLEDGVSRLLLETGDKFLLE